MSSYRIAPSGRALVALLVMVATALPGAASAEESKRLARAKDLIAEEQWAAARVELRAAVADPRERNLDEGLFWLAHTEFQSGEPLAAIATIQRLEREHPRSRWVRPARSLRVEIAQRLRREDVLWRVAAPPEPLPAPAPPAEKTPPAPPAPRAGTVAPAQPPPPPPPPALTFWFPEDYRPDTDQRILALGSLIRTDASKVIPMLREIALSSDDAAEARRAVFVLAQSGKPEARTTVVEVARTAAPEAVRIAAVRELGRFGGPEVSAELRALYSAAPSVLKRPIIQALFTARADGDLIRIAAAERDQALRHEALARLRLLATPAALQYLEKVKEP